MKNKTLCDLLIFCLWAKNLVKVVYSTQTAGLIYREKENKKKILFMGFMPACNMSTCVRGGGGGGSST